MENNANVSIRDIVKGIVALVFVAAIIVIAVVALVHLLSPAVISIGQAFSGIDVAIMVAFVTGAISIVSVIVGAIAKTKMEYSQRKQEFLTQQRIEPYKKLVGIIYKVQQKSNASEEYSESEMIDDIGEFNQGLTLWGSTKAIQKWGAWRLTAKEGFPNPHETLFAMEDVMIQLRIDLGQSKGLKKGDLLRMFITDIDEYI